jgi:cellulose synthase/poly-beta-1,6-N-acetylglucosamine synthase-like glycosyltransferase
VLTFLFWFFVAPAALAALFSIRMGRRYLEYVEAALHKPVEEDDPEDEPPPDPYLPPVSLIVPVKGLDHDLSENLRSLAAQDYPDFELIIVCCNATDEAVRVARLALEDRARVLVSDQPPGDTGEKVHNLRYAVRLARLESEVFVFADSDGQVTSGWLRALVSPLHDESIGATTGFRWYFPEEGGFWPLLRSVWDSTIAGNMNTKDHNFAWGGGMAVRRETFERARVADFWKGAVSDDYRLTHALDAAGLGIRFVPGAMVATTGHCSRQEFLDWARRQLTITKVYRRKLWIAGFISHVFYCGAMVMSLAMALTGSPLALMGFVVTVIPGMGKGAMRSYAARLMFPERHDWLDRFSWAYFWLVPVATWVWLYTFARSAVTRTIEWRGNVYELIAPDRTRSLSRAAPSA